MSEESRCGSADLSERADVCVRKSEALDEMARNHLLHRLSAIASEGERPHN